MPKASPRASAQIANPILNPVNGLTPVRKWQAGFLGIYYEFVETETTIRLSGLVPEGTPYPSLKKQSFIRGWGDKYRLSRLGDGRLRLRISADLIIERDKNFRIFLGGLLADSRLSLVKGEEA